MLDVSISRREKNVLEPEQGCGEGATNDADAMNDGTATTRVGMWRGRLIVFMVRCQWRAGL